MLLHRADDTLRLTHRSTAVSKRETIKELWSRLTFLVEITFSEIVKSTDVHLMKHDLLLKSEDNTDLHSRGVIYNNK